MSDEYLQQKEKQVEPAELVKAQKMEKETEATVVYGALLT